MLVGRSALAFLLTASLSIPCAVAATEVGAVAQVSNDWLYHGNSEVLGESVFGLNLEWNLPSNWFVGLEAHRAREPSRIDVQRQRSVLAYVGREFALGDRWHTNVSVQHRQFPGSTVDWDFTELSARLSHDWGWSAKLDYSPDYYARDTSAVALEVRFDDQITDRSYWYVEAGALELGANQFLDHQYAAAGLGVAWASSNLDLAYHWNSRKTDEFFGIEPFSPSQWIVRLSYRLW